MNNDPRSHGLWEASAPPAPQTQSLAEDLTVDVAIVGAGYTGLSAALHLARGGASTAVIEAVDIGFGGSGRNVGLVNAGMWVMPSALRDELGDTYGPRLLTLLGNAPSVVFELVERHGLECEAVRAGTLHCAVGSSGQAQIAERARQWGELGAPVELLDARQTCRMTGTRAFAGSLLDRRAGTIQPLAYARGLASAAIGAGARVYTQTQPTRVEDAGSTWRLHMDSGGSVTARWVIVATDAYSVAAGVWPQIQSELVRLPYFNLATAPLPKALCESILPERQGAWDTRPVLSSFRLDGAGRLVFGSVGALRGTGRSIHRAWGQRALAKLFPQLKEVEFEHEWYGMIGMTSNALPRFHQLARNVVSFSGFNGRGIAPGTVFGRELAKLALGEIAVSNLPLPVASVRTAPFRAIREAGYETGAQVVHLAGARVTRGLS